MNLKLKDQKIAIGAIFKNEGPYILEWIAFHRVIGVDYFFIADNDSTDGSGELLRALEDLGYIKYLHFPTSLSEPPQLPAYRELMARYSHLADWVVFIDADEFAIPSDNLSIKNSLRKILENSQGIGAVALNWATYGSAGRKEYSSELVIERFPKRASKDFGVNRHYKSVVRVAAYDSTHQNPHLFNLKSGYHYVGADGKSLVHDVKGIKGLSEHVCWENLKINHYIVKSYDEFLFKKNRGRATVNGNAGLNRNLSFFNGHDKNDEQEKVDYDLITKTKSELESMRKKLSKKGISVKVTNITIPKPNISITAAVDKVTKVENLLEITGWAFASNLQEASFTIGIENHLFEIQNQRKINRVDVVKHVNGAPSDAGFIVSIDLKDVPGKLFNEEIYLNIAVGEFIRKFSTKINLNSL